MDPSVILFRTQCHYYDDSNVCHVAPDDLDSLPRNSSEYTLTDGRIVRLFMDFNPFLLVLCNETQLAYRNCILCGDIRFADPGWNALPSCRPGGADQSTLMCNKMSCLQTWFSYADGGFPQSVKSRFSRS